MSQTNGLSKFKAKLEKDTRSYHPGWNVFTGSPMATMILQDVNYWWWLEWPDHDPGTPFYRDETEWLHRLGVGRKSFLNNRDKIGRQIKMNKNETHETVFAEGHLLAWMTDQRRKTWYWLNMELMDTRLTELYFPESLLGIQENNTVSESPLGIQRIPKGDSDTTETTTETTEEEEALDSLGSVGETPEEEPESSQPVRVDLDDDGEFVPTKDYDKNNPFFRLVMNNVLGHPKNLQGHERKDWMDIQRRAVEDLEFKAWVIWQSQNNAKGKRLKVLMEFVNNELDFGDWTRNAFKAASPENIAGAKRGARGGTNKPVNDAALRVEEESLPHESEMTREQLRALLK